MGGKTQPEVIRTRTETKVLSTAEPAPQLQMTPSIAYWGFREAELVAPF